MKSKENDDFYEELDRSKHRVTFGCSSLLLLLLFLLISGGYIVWWGISQIKAKVKSDNIPVSQIALEKAESKLQSFLKGNQKQGEAVSIALTDQELTSLLVKSQALSTTDKYEIKNPNAVISEDGIKINGLLTKPVESRITAQVKPIIDNGEVKLEVEKITAGNLNIPKPLRAGAEQLLQNLTTSRLNSKDIKYESAVMGNHVLTLIGVKK